MSRNPRPYFSEHPVPAASTGVVGAVPSKPIEPASSPVASAPSAKRAKLTMLGNERRTINVGDELFEDELAGLIEGVHYT